MVNSRLNVDVGRSISEFKSFMKEFELKKKIFQLMFRGRSLEFEQFRTFTPEDDASDIDWKVSKRVDQLLVRQYREERNQKIVFVVDVSDHMIFGSKEKLKCEYVAEVVCALSHLIMESDDKPGILLYSDRIVEYIPPARGKHHFSRMVDVLTDSKNYGGGSKPSLALDFLFKTLGGNIDSVIFVSDFTSIRKEVLFSFLELSSLYEVLAIMVRDELDISLPDIRGELVIEDPVSGNQLIVDPKVAGKEYALYANEQMDLVRGLFDESMIDLLELKTSVAFAPALAMFLTERVRNVRRIL